jgi:hypothetical protein
MLSVVMGFRKFINRNTPLFPAWEPFALAALSVESFICNYRSHEHDQKGEGSECSVCIQLDLARHALNSLAYITAALIAASALRSKKTAKILSFCFVIPATLISLKVKSNT